MSASCGVFVGEHNVRRVCYMLGHPGNTILMLCLSNLNPKKSSSDSAVCLYYRVEVLLCYKFEFVVLFVIAPTVVSIRNQNHGDVAFARPCAEFRTPASFTETRTGISRRGGANCG